MNVKTPQEMAEILEMIRSTEVCAYAAPGNKKFCDCKYLDGIHLQQCRPHGEKNGCCEMREAIALFKTMPQSVYDGLQGKKRKVLKVKKHKGKFVIREKYPPPVYWYPRGDGSGLDIKRAIKFDTSAEAHAFIQTYYLNSASTAEVCEVL